MLMRPDQRTQQRDFLLEITRAITAQLDLSEVLRRVLHASLVMLAGRVGVVALGDKHDNRFSLRAYSGISADDVPELNGKLQELMNPQDEGGFSRDFLNSKLREMADLIDPRLAQSIAMPLVFARKPLGLLIVFRSYQTAITPEDLDTLQSFADQAAIAVNNAQLYGEINQERQRLEAILNNSGDGVFILKPDLSFQQVNRAFERMTGWPQEDSVDRPKSDVIVWDSLESRDIEDALDAGWAQDSARGAGPDALYVEGDLLRRDGMKISIGITYAPMLTEDGRLESIIANVRDISNFRKAQEMQSVFISTVHHELRTPIAIIKGYASTLGRDDVEWDSAVIRENLAIIEDEADRLTNLVEDLLTASKIQAARELRLNLADTDLRAIAARSVERLEGQTSHSIVMSFPEDFPVIPGDEIRLRQVIENLLTNAIKYSPEDKTITVGGRFTEKSVTVFVRDEGAGIPKDQIDKVYERFYRVDDNLTSRTQGAGLGLYLVKAIVEAHGGEISAKSQIGSGSTFFFTLPRD
ncbi:MAG: ATP-binding protein [Chloroflexota bacterium]|nr:ATP-binding protein [Chloroflexota bacterium]MDE2948123.1 ATP-binding protein [Chloroflexota bacterium]